MKPRLDPAPYTDEDWGLMKAATLRWMFRHEGPFPLAQIYVPSDRRDADLMLHLALDREAYGRFMWPESLWEQYIADGGDGLREWT